MGWINDLDAAIQQRFESLQISGSTAFRTVGPLTARGRTSVPSEMLGADKPALLYAIERVPGSEKDLLARVEALLIAEGLRGLSAAWRGDDDTVGAYELSEAAAQCLAQTDLAGTAGAWLRQQRLAHVDGRRVAFLQEYDVIAKGDSILLDEQNLVGTRSVVHLADVVGKAEWQSEGFVGSSEAWAKWQGRGPERITLAGALWAADENSLETLEQGIDGVLDDDQLHTLSVGAQPSWEHVALILWERLGQRVHYPMLDLVGQQIRMEFAQYQP